MRNSIKRLVRRTRETVLRVFSRWERLDCSNAWEDSFYCRNEAWIECNEHSDKSYRIRIVRNNSVTNTSYFASLTAARAKASEYCRYQQLKSDGRWNSDRFRAIREEDARLAARRSLNRES